ncbi:MAG: hypothetical protein A4S09_11740 [Proteobacteria bacterium SG_bin7]|nr:MAG: hypothetical protein A4S09_11740 [Proteobacteria bacterium SG_bin7]
MALAPVSPAVEKNLEVLNGPNKGQIFPILTNQVRVGRSPENEVVIDDPKCSRVQFVIALSDGTATARDVANKNALVVNGKKVKQIELKNGDVIRAGDTELKYRDLAAAMQAYNKPQPLGVAQPGAGALPFPSAAPRRRKSGRQEKQNATFYIILVTVIVLFYFIFSGSKKQDNTYKIGSDNVAEIERLNKSKLAEQERQRLAGKNSREYIDAQASFIRGFRDYQNGQFILANRAFREALAIYPKHEMAEHYRKMSDQRIQEFIQSQLQEGRVYRERNNYTLCSAAYRKAMDALGDNKLDDKYKLAASGFAECETLLKGRF